MKTKQSAAALVRLVETALGDDAPKGIRPIVTQIHAMGSPPNKVGASVAVFFLPEGAPFCCGESFCHMPVLLRPQRIAERLRRDMNLSADHELDIEFTVTAHYYPGFRSVIDAFMAHIDRCPCCDCWTLPGRASCQICPVGWWEDYDRRDGDPDEVKPAHALSLSLRQARRNYALYGACSERFRDQVRLPEPRELDSFYQPS